MNDIGNINDRTQHAAYGDGLKFSINDTSPDAKKDVEKEKYSIPGFQGSVGHAGVFHGDITCARDCCGGKLIAAGPGTVVWAVKDCSAQMQSALQEHFFAVLHVPDSTFIPGSAHYTEKDGYTLYPFYLWDGERSLRDLTPDEKRKAAPVVFRELLALLQEGQRQNALADYSPLVKMQIRKNKHFFGFLCCLTQDTVYVRFRSGKISIRILPLPVLNGTYPELYPAAEANGEDADFSTDLYAVACIFLLLQNGASEMKDVDNLPGEENSYLNLFFLRCLLPFPQMRPALEEVNIVLRELEAESRTIPAKKNFSAKKPAAAAEQTEDETDTESGCWQLPFSSFSGGDLLEKVKGFFGKESPGQTDATEV